MLYLPLFLFCLVTWPGLPQAWGAPISLEEILSSVRATPKDLALRAELVTDPYRLKIATQLLENPGSALESSHAAATELMASTQPARALAWLAEKIEAPTVRTSPSTAANAPIPSAPQELRGILEPLLGAIERAQRKVDEVLKALPVEKRGATLRLFQSQLMNTLPDPKRLKPGQTWIEEDQELLSFAGSVPLIDILSAAYDLTNILEKTLPELKSLRLRFHPKQTMTLTTPYGKILLGSSRTDTFDEYATLLVDFGGDDTYRKTALQSRPGSVQVLIDLEGQDRYLAQGFGAMGSGIFGIQLLIDAQGQDVYIADDASQGAGLFGFGLLWDLEGNDLYQARSFSQAAGAFGIGILLDDKGEDLYRASYLSQGAGYIRGAGLLRDLSGNDAYSSGFSEPDPRGIIENYGRFKQGEVFQSLSQGFGLGWRDMAGGGIGFLLDGAGNDHYLADYFGQGAGYWFGWGMLYDNFGNDAYQARRYAQGAGIHFAVGTLLDSSGDDLYRSWAVSQGLGHDYALGVLWDGEGYDDYVGDWAVMGFSNAMGVGILRDQGGQDRYLFRHGAFSTWDEKRNAAGLGLFLDSGIERNDFRVEKATYVFNRNFWSVGAAGVEDLSWGALPRARAEILPDNNVYARVEEKEEEFLSQRLGHAKALGTRSYLSELLAISSGWGIQSSVPLEAKRELLSQEPSKALPVLAQFIHPKNIFARMILEEYFLSAPESRSTLKALIMSSQDEIVRARAAHYLGALRLPEIAPTLMGALQDPSWRVRAAAARALGTAQSGKLRQKLEKLLQLLEKPELSSTTVTAWFQQMEKSETLWFLSYAARLSRAEWSELAPGLVQEPTAGVSAEKASSFLLPHRDSAKKLAKAWVSSTPQGLEKLEQAISDPHPEVRRWAVYSFGLLEAQDAKPLAHALTDSDYAVREAAAMALSRLGAKVLPALKSALASQDARLRSQALKALAGIPDKTLRRIFEKYVKDRDASVRFSALQALAEGERANLWKVKGNLLRRLAEDESNLWVRGLAQTLLESR